MKRTAIAAVLSAATLLALSACSGDETAPDAKLSATATAPTTSAAVPKSGLPPKPTGQVRADLLAALKAVAPGTVRYEDKAVDAARNQCQAINGGGSKLDWTASQRFTYKDVTTTEAQGKSINEALKKSGFCNT
ncbi:hypothetical protein [Streptomyces sp. NBC_00572]|uniref:hypothetical protein n=1 Tax=Streptomyces sp. NBC_00572 TaxID=2903664 RepID=UPI00224F02EC|nr:hypothetical protein [Streptomyces sp. NBC_00572]MCX4987137.1 hypothetical protein [Streptomyces sp. NBC_00572]